MTECDLERFVAAQDAICYPEDGCKCAPAPTIDMAMCELRRGKKYCHWMWFVFPQMRGLGHSDMAETYGIGSLAEARAYLAHPVLGPRLVACASAMLDVEDRSAVQVLGCTDARKLRSSMTLFAIADPDQTVFAAVLEKYDDGFRDPRTRKILGPE